MINRAKAYDKKAFSSTRLQVGKVVALLKKGHVGKDRGIEDIVKAEWNKRVAMGKGKKDVTGYQR